MQPYFKKKLKLLRYVRQSLLFFNILVFYSRELQLAWFFADFLGH